MVTKKNIHTGRNFFFLYSFLSMNFNCQLTIPACGFGLVAVLPQGSHARSQAEKSSARLQEHLGLSRAPVRVQKTMVH